MSHEIIVAAPRQILQPGCAVLPTLFTAAGEKAAEKLLEFFTAQIRNKHTRAAYARAVWQFAGWCEEHGFQLGQLTPVIVAAYIEQLGQRLADPSVKQHLAAVRVLFDFLVVQQVVPHNPAASVRGPKHVVKKGKTPVLTAEEARLLLDSIDVRKVAGLRDRALIGTMVFSFARIGAVLKMDTDDFYLQGKRWWIRLHEKGGKHHEVPAHHKAQEYLHEYLDAGALAGRKGVPLFPTLDRKRCLTEVRLSAREALAMIKRRARKAGIGDRICCHTFRATGITAYLRNGGTIDMNQPYYLHRQIYPGLRFRRESPVALSGLPLILARPYL